MENPAGRALTTEAHRAHAVADGFRQLADVAERCPRFGVQFDPKTIRVGVDDPNEFITIAEMLGGNPVETGGWLVVDFYTGPLVIDLYISVETLDLVSYRNMVAERVAVDQAMDVYEDVDLIGGAWQAEDEHRDYLISLGARGLV